MRIVIFGTGGVGGYFGGRLAQAGEDVTFIARGEHLRAIQENGLQIKDFQGDFLIRPARAMEPSPEAGPADVVLVAVKAWQVPEAAQAIKSMLSAHGFVVPLENGVDAPAQLADVLGKERVLAGTCAVSAFISAPGQITHAPSGAAVTFGELDNRTSERSARLLEIFQRAGIEARIPADIQVALWEKFLFIGSINAVGAITRAPLGAYRSIPETRHMLRAGIEEVAAVGFARHVNLPEDAVDQAWAAVDQWPASLTGSMQRDIMNGRPSELESLNGAVIRLGTEVGVNTPTHRFLYASLLPMEQRARGQIQF